MEARKAAVVSSRHDVHRLMTSEDVKRRSFRFSCRDLSRRVGVAGGSHQAATGLSADRSGTTRRDPTAALSSDRRAWLKRGFKYGRACFETRIGTAVAGSTKHARHRRRNIAVTAR